MSNNPYAWLDALLPSTVANAKPSTKDPLVFIGTGYKFDQSGKPMYELGQQQQRAVSSTAAGALYYDWDDKTKSQFKAAVTLAGKDTTGWQDGDYAAEWRKYVGQAGAYYRNGQGKAVTPWDILVMDRANREAQGPVTTTNTSTSVNLSTQADVSAAAYDIARTLLGRAPTDAEIAKYTSVINARERANPTTTTTTTTTQPGGSSSSSSSTSGGFSAAAAQDEIRKQAQATEGYAEHQAATTYFNAFMQMLGG